MKLNAVLFTFLYTLCSVAHASENWILKKRHKAIDTYVRDVNGSKYKAAKHVTTINVSLRDLLEAIGDGKSCSPWLALCVSAKVINQVDEREYLGYAVIDMPWPLSNRDLVYRSIKTVDTSTGSIEIKQIAEPESYPKTDWVRMISKSTYLLEPIEKQRVRFTWTVHSNPGGKVPVSIVNSRIHKDTRRDLLTLIEQVTGS